MRLFCFPYAGRGASLFYSWSKDLPGEIEVCPVQLPGRENRLREEAYSSLPELIPILVAALTPYLDRPYAFFGHSMGALIAFELARYLQQGTRRSVPVHLFVSGHRAPHLSLRDRQASRLPEAEFIEALRRLQGTPEEVFAHPELLALLLPLLRADFSLCETYTYTFSRPLSCPITAFGGLQDQETARAALSAWREHTSSSFRVRFFPGGHFFLEQEQKALLNVLAQDIFSTLSSRQIL